MEQTTRSQIHSEQGIVVHYTQNFLWFNAEKIEYWKVKSVEERKKQVQLIAL